MQSIVKCQHIAMGYEIQECVLSLMLANTKGRFTQFSSKNSAIFCTHICSMKTWLPASDGSFWWTKLFSMWWKQFSWLNMTNFYQNQFQNWHFSVRKELAADFSAPWSCLHTKNLDWTVATLLQIYAQTNEQFNFETILKLCLPLII